jgi:hypothetical protein
MLNGAAANIPLLDVLVVPKQQLLKTVDAKLLHLSQVASDSGTPDHLINS